MQDAWEIINEDGEKKYSFFLYPTIDNGGKKSMSLLIEDKVIEGKTYPIDGVNIRASYSSSEENMRATNGYIKITKRKVDTTKQGSPFPYKVIISGLFEFSGVNEKGKEIKVTDGRFDVTATTNYID